jgi:SAM-dependent methyltransferase
MAAHAGADGALVRSPYIFKPGPYSSHAHVLTSLPAAGEGRRVLDIGCGDGQLGALLAARGYRVTGIEKPQAVHGPFPASVELVEADLDLGWPALAGRYDFIVCADVLEHLKAPEKLLGELPRLMAPGARLVASLPNAVNLYVRLNVLSGRFPRHERGLFDRTHLHFYTWSGWVELLAAAGFRIEKLVPTGIPFGLALRRWEGTLPVRALEALGYAAARLWKRLFAYQFVVLACHRGPA